MADALGRALAPYPDLKVLDANPVTGLETVDLVELYRPDILLVEYWMDGMQAPAIVQSLRGSVPDCKSIVLSWFHGAAEVQNCLSAGAVGFLPQSGTVDRLVEAIRLALQGEVPVFAAELRGMMQTIERRSEESGQAWIKLSTLTRRELQILALLSMGLSVQQIAERVFISPKTARNHVDNMLAKTETHSQAEMLNLARTHGLIAG